jgi:hypothetical protein
MRGHGLLDFFRPAQTAMKRNAEARKINEANEAKNLKEAENRKINEVNEAKNIKELAARGTTAGRRRKTRKDKRKTHRRRR